MNESLTPLQSAISRGQQFTAEKILQSINPGDPEIDKLSTYERRSALSYAANKGNLVLVKLLLGKGAAVNLACANKRTPLSYAAGQGRVAVVETLLEQSGIDRDVVDAFKFTALDHARMFGERAPEGIEGGEERDDAERIIGLLTMGARK